MIYSIQVRRKLEHRTMDNWKKSVSTERACKKGRGTYFEELMQAEQGEAMRTFRRQQGGLFIESLNSDQNQARFRSHDDSSQSNQQNLMMKLRKSQKVESLLKVLRENLLSWQRKLSRFDQDSEMTMKDLIKEAQSCISQYQFTPNQRNDPLTIQKKVIGVKKLVVSRAISTGSQQKKGMSSSPPPRKRQSQHCRVIVPGICVVKPGVSERLSLYLQEVLDSAARSGSYIQPQMKVGGGMRFHVGRGNNSSLVKQVMTRRWWWKQLEVVEEDEPVNFVWTQLRSLRFSERMPSLMVGQAEEEFTRCHTLIVTANLVQTDTSFKPGKGMVQKALKRARQENYSISSSSQGLLVHNHIEMNWVLGTKKSLLEIMTRRLGDRVFDHIPVSYNIQSLEDPQFEKFRQYSTLHKDEIWIVKPGQDTNRGRGIRIFADAASIREHIGSKSKYKGFVVQLYLRDLLLYRRRKFDIRCFMMVTAHNLRLRAFWYREGYIRTSSVEFSAGSPENLLMHLTNDAVQKKSQLYGKFESGNKVSFSDFDRYFKECNYEKTFLGDVYPQLKVPHPMEAARAASPEIQQKRMSSFEVVHFNYFIGQLFGLDFMIDNNFKAWLIEVNTNPCLEFSCPLLQCLLTDLIDNVLRIGLDPIFPPPMIWPVNKQHLLPDVLLKPNKFEEFDL